MVSYEHKVKNIYLGEPGWNPGENTILYMPFNNDLLDHSGNDIQITHDNYLTIVNDSAIGRNVGYVNNGTISYCTLPDTYSEYTFSYRKKSTYTGRHNDIYWDIGSNGYCIGHEITTYRATGGIVGELTLDAYNTNDIENGQRHNIIVTVGPGGTSCTLDGELKSFISGKLSTLTETSLFCRKHINRGQLWNQSTLYASELIFESKARTAEEISDYYENTKGNYGL